MEIIGKKLKMTDNLGITTIKIFNLYKNTSLTSKELRKKTKQILEDFKNKEIESSYNTIKKLQKDSLDLITIKRILK